MRLMYAKTGGYPGVSWDDYVDFRSMSKGFIPFVFAPLGFMLIDLEQKLEHRECAYRRNWGKQSKIAILLMLLFYSVNAIFLLFWLDRAKTVTHDLDPIFTVSTGFAYVWVHLYR